MERYPDILELLEEVKVDIDIISASYERARNDEDQLKILRPKIKSCFEHLRSALEYSAQDIWRSYTKKKNSVYFPYGKTEEDLNKSLNRNLPALKDQSPILFDLVEALQPHKCGSEWLYELCRHTNFNKHDRLSPQKRENSANSNTTFGCIVKNYGSSDSSFTDCYYNGIPIANSGTVEISAKRRVSEIKKDLFVPIPVLREFDWVEFKIEGSLFDVLKLITTSYSQVSKFTQELNGIL
ncbi:hypothetical protein QF019_002418 [Pseudomonas frederiksbergensis]|uniref:hypothetical protein n=1 Tax=Pseudomonas frederiksbergensis TaxID=104087 RepID=UPI003D1BD261